jgi:hypothetical protein
MGKELGKCRSKAGRIFRAKRRAGICRMLAVLVESILPIADGVGMDAIVDLGQGALEIPIEL